MAWLFCSHTITRSIRQRRRQSGTSVGGPWVCIMRAGERCTAIGRVRIEGILHHVMACHADDMNEQLTQERLQGEAPPHLAAVYDESAGVLRRVLLPLGQYIAASVIEPDEELDGSSAVPRPVVRRREPRCPGSRRRGKRQNSSRNSAHPDS